MRRVSVLVSLVVLLAVIGLASPEAGPFAAEEQIETFEIVWTTIRDTYFDPAFGGLDWTEVYDRYRSLILDAEDTEEFYWLLNLMIFELDRSHGAVIPPGDEGLFLPGVYASGSAGIDLRRLDDDVTVVSVQPGSPADVAGLRPGFLIESIDHVPVRKIIEGALEHSTPPFNERGQAQTVDNALLGRVYGTAGTTVTLTYQDEHGEAHTVQLIREARGRISTRIQGMPPAYLEFESRWLSEDIGYVRFNTFHIDVVPDFARAIESMRDAHGVIIDLRGNPGGYLDALLEVAGHVLADSTVLLTLVTHNETTEMVAVPAAHTYLGPLVLLIDVRCTSGSEMLSASLQALGRAVVVGEDTSGSVTGANMLSLPCGALLMYPFVQTLSADGKDPEGAGVTPDIATRLDRAELLQGIDAQLQAAWEHLVALDGDD